MSINRFMTHATLAAVLFAASLAMTAPAYASDKAAGDKPAGGATSAGSASLSPDSPAALRAEAQRLGSQLNAIEDKALKSDKELSARGRHLAATVADVMKKHGFFIEADQQELMRLKKEIDSGKLSKEDRAARIHEFRGVQARVIKGRMVAMKDKAVQKERAEYGQAMAEAMQKQDPRTKQMIVRLNNIKRQLMAMYRAQQQAAQQHAAQQQGARE